MMDQNKRKSLLVKCLVASLILHLGGVVFLYNNPFLLSPAFHSLFSRLLGKPGPLIREDEGIAKNRVLEEAFQELVILPPQAETPFDLEYTLSDPLAPPLVESSEHTLPVPFAEELLKENEQTFLSVLPQENPSDLIAPLIMEQVETSAAIPSSKLTPPKPTNFIEELPLAQQVIEQEEEESLLTDAGSPQQMESKQLPQSDGNLALPFQSQFPSSGLATEEDKKVPLLIPKSASSHDHGKPSLAKAQSLPEIAAYSLPDSQQDFAWRDDFDIAVHLMPEKEEGYVFTLVLTPKPDHNAERIPQNFYFLIDRSHSIDKNRFATFKKGVLKALPFIQEGDTFNIAIFDNKITKLSEKNLPAVEKSFQLAAEFLDKEQFGGRFSSGDLYTYLDKIIPFPVPHHSINTAILLSNGKTSLNSKKRQKAIQQWMQKNEGKVALYTAAIGQDNNLVMLDLLSSCNGGELLYSDTHSAFGRKLAKLVLHLKDPIAKDIMLYGMPSDPDVQITFYPVSAYLPAFYQGKPYVIQGTIDQLSDFTLLFEGMNGDQKLQIAKKISFEKAHKANTLFAKKWENRRASLYYERFLESGKEEELLQAKNLLKNTCGEIAFE